MSRKFPEEFTGCNYTASAANGAISGALIVVDASRPPVEVKRRLYRAVLSMFGFDPLQIIRLMSRWI